MATRKANLAPAAVDDRAPDAGAPLTRTTLKKTGGSLVMTVPAAARDALGLLAGTEMAVSIEDGRLVLEPMQRSRPRYSLAALLAQCDPSAPHTKEERAWIDAPPVGRELW